MGGTTDRNSLSARQANGAAMLVEVDTASASAMITSEVSCCLDIRETMEVLWSSD